MVVFLVKREHKMRPFVSHLNMLELENSKLRKIVQALQEQEQQVNPTPTSPVRATSLATHDERMTQATSGVITSRAISPTRCPPPQSGANVGGHASSLASCHLTSPMSSSTNISNNARPCTLPPPEFTSGRRFNPSERMLKLPSAEEVKSAYEARLSSRSPGYNCTCRPSGSPTGCTDTRRPTTGKMTPTSRPPRAVTVKPSPRILGEIAFQLENRILDYIFSSDNVADVDLRERRGFYGYTVRNIPVMIQQEYTNLDGSIDEHIRLQLKDKLKLILMSLAQFGYSLDEHSSFSDQIINEYGLLAKAPDGTTLEIFGLGDADTLRDFVAHLARDGEDSTRMLVLLECLLYLAKEDCGPVFLY